MKALYCEVSRTYDPPVCSECGKLVNMSGHVCMKNVNLAPAFSSGGTFDKVSTASAYRAIGMTDPVLSPANVFAALGAVKQKHFAATPMNCETDENYDSPRRF
jgi:hypothetical protein